MGQQSWEPDPGTSRLLASGVAGQVLQLQSRGRQGKTAKQPACHGCLHPCRTTTAPSLQANLSNWQILRENRILLCSKAPFPARDQLLG